MRSLDVKLAAKVIEPSLLLEKVGAWRLGCFLLQGEVHALVATNFAVVCPFGIAPRTVEMDRANLGAALGASSLAQVLRLTLGLALHPLVRG